MTPNPANPYPAPAPPQAPRSNRTTIFVVIGVLALTCLCGVPAAFFLWAASLPESGVIAGNQLEDSHRASVNKRVPLETGEEIAAYYDTTLKVDGSEVAVLTTKRLVYWKGTTVTTMRHDEIVRLTREDLMGTDIVTALTADGRLIRVELAPLNDGQVFIDALELATGLRTNGPARTGQKVAPSAEPEIEPTPIEEPEPAPLPRKRHK